MIAWAHRGVADGQTIALVAATAAARTNELSELLRQLETAAVGSGVAMVGGEALAARIMPYTGLGPMGFGVGVLQNDRLIRQSCHDAGYVPADGLVEWTVDAARFRMPVNRSTITLRRTLGIEFVATLAGSPEHAVRGCHLQQMMATSGDGNYPSDLRFYTSDPELPILDPTVSLFQIRSELPTADDRFGDVDAYVLGQWIVRAAQDGVRRVATTLPADAPEAEALSVMGFRPGETGHVWQRP